MALKKFGTFITIGMAAGVALASPVHAQDDGSVAYTMEAGDTLYGLAQEYFVSEEAALRVQRFNRISNARAIPVGAVIDVPRSLLKWDPVTLRVAFFTGQVTIAQNGREQAPQRAQQVPQNSIISTGERSFISLQGEGRTAVSLPSNSRVQIRRARRYRIDQSLDVDLRVLKGRGEITAPKLRDGERFRTGTPIAVTAVRGTEFRVGYDEASALALTEVTEGLVEISADGAAVAAEAGKGVASNPSGLGEPEDLLIAPEISGRSATQTGETVAFSITPLTGATAYRTQIASDVTFTDVIDEQVSSELNIEFFDVDDGRYSVRTRAIAASGLEGFWQGEDASFRRKRVGTSVAAEPAPFADAYKFAWLPEGAGPSYTAFQMWPKDAPDTLIVDEVGLDAPGIYLSDLAPGIYSWRVATSVIDEGEVIKVWTEARDLTVSE
ncbi:FecR domain-containing protein [uncultured Erythrobacter sp.]|uniref:FecR domain-containing protein n=1 Tax=uncultured Erythrobacter sp. TaxID=263913 RepID=UPI002637E317|nr:FecR domain-containing protein [uncultured Erythrobacter sp.]